MKQVFLQAKRLGTDEPMGDVMGPMTEISAERVTRGMLINMRSDCYVDEWPADNLKEPEE